MLPNRHICAAAAAVLLLGFGQAPATAQLAMTDQGFFPRSIFQQVPADRAPQYEATAPYDAGVPGHLRRQVVAYNGREAPGTIIIDTANTYLYYVLGGGRAIRYGIGVGREGFTWSGTQSIARMSEWPDWHPPAEMIERQPNLPRFMAGGPGNPLGARALYLGNSLYRIHGTNAPASIGQKATSGCIRLLNEDVVDLYNRVHVGTKVVVLPDTPGRVIAQQDYSQARAQARYEDAVQARALSREPLTILPSRIY